MEEAAGVPVPMVIDPDWNAADELDEDVEEFVVDVVEVKLVVSVVDCVDEENGTAEDDCAVVSETVSGGFCESGLVVPVSARDRRIWADQAMVGIKIRLCKTAIVRISGSRNRARWIVVCLESQTPRWVSNGSKFECAETLPSLVLINWRMRRWKRAGQLVVQRAIGRGRGIQTEDDAEARCPQHCESK